MDRKAWMREHNGWVAGGSTGGALFGMMTAKQVDHGRVMGTLIAAVVAVVVALFIPNVVWFFAADGRRAQR